ncbi:unnamed protein product [Closterium sp. NIES-54]
MPPQPSRRHAATARSNVPPVPPQVMARKRRGTWGFGRQRPGAWQVLPCAGALAAFFATLLLASAAAFWLGAQPAAEALIRSLLAPSAAPSTPLSAEEEPGESIDGEPINGKSSGVESLDGGTTGVTEAAAASAFGSASFLLEENASVPRILEFDLVKTYPHDNRAFTQGLLYADHEASGGRGTGEGVFYESTGEYGRSVAWHRHDIEWHGMVWHGVAWRGWRGVHGMAWRGMAWHGIAWHSMAWHGEVAACSLRYHLWHTGATTCSNTDVPRCAIVLPSCRVQLGLRVLSLVRGGMVLNSVPQSDDVFGEGLALHDNRYIAEMAGKVRKNRDVPAGLACEVTPGLAWRVQKGLVYDRDTLQPRGSFQHGMADGWGLSVLNESIMVGTDGSSTLFHLDSSSFKAVARVTVKDGKRSIPNLNELEVVGGLVWANVWLSTCLAAIHPDTGKVLAWLDLSSLQ